MVLFFSSYIALEPLALDDDFADEEDLAELDETFLLDEEFALLLLDFELSFLLLLDFAELPLLLLDFLTELLDTGSSESALLPLSPPQATRKNTDTAHIANNFFI